MINPTLLALLACPRCRGPVEPVAGGDWLACRPDALAFPVTDGIACLVMEAARPLAEIAQTDGRQGPQASG